jgi:hypothetical protein
VAFQGGDKRFTGDLVDLSTTGLLLRCSEDMALGSMGKMAIPVGHETCRAVVVAKRRLPGIGIAFEFTHLSIHDRELLRRLLMRMAGAAEL